MRRWLVVALLAAAVAPATAVSDWTGWKGGATQNMARAEPTGTADDPLWTTPFDAGYPDCLTAGGGDVHVVIREEGAAAGVVTAVDTTDGGVLWTSDPVASPSTCPATDADHVYVTSRSSGAGSGLTAIDRTDGSVAWHTDWSPNGQALTHPIASGGMVAVGGVYTGPPPGNELRHVYRAFDADNGQVLWTSGNDAYTEVPPIAAGASGDVVIGGYGSDLGNGTVTGIRAMSPADGTQLWSTTTCGGVHERLLSAGASVFCATGSTIYSLNAQSGALQWSHVSPDPVQNLAVDSTRVYAALAHSPFGPSRTEAINRATGTQIWNVLNDGAWYEGLFSALGTTVFELDDRRDTATGAAVPGLGSVPLLGGTAGTPFPPAAYDDGVFYIWWAPPGLPFLEAVSDTTPPDLTITSPPGGEAFQTKNPRPTVTFTATDLAPWDVGDTPSGTGLSRVEVKVDDAAPQVLPAGATSFQPAAALSEGAHTYAVKAFDVRDNVTTKTVSFVIDFTPTPVAAIDASEDLILTGTKVTFSAAGSHDTDIDGQLVSYQWDLDGDGTFEVDTGGSPTASHTYDQQPPGPISIRVTSDSGFSASAGTTLDVRPAPPAGEVGVSINGGDVATNDPDVNLSLAWPRFANAVLISNDGGFGPAGSTEQFPLTTTRRWTLASSGPERLPKVVYVRFKGAGSDNTPYTDDIILDQRRPKVRDASLGDQRHGGSDRSDAKRTYKVSLSARDDNSGVAIAEFAKQQSGKPLAQVRFTPPDKRGKREVDQVVEIKASTRPRFARVIDSGGNRSEWERIHDKRRNL